jgi:hypothetical protein
MFAVAGAGASLKPDVGGPSHDTPINGDPVVVEYSRHTMCPVPLLEGEQLIAPATTSLAAVVAVAVVSVVV